MDPAASVRRREYDVLCLSDSPKLTTGFATVAREVYRGLADAGLNILVIGGMDDRPDADGELTYPFVPLEPREMVTDTLGHQVCARLLSIARPRVLWVMTDPGNLARLLFVLRRQLRSPADQPFPIPIVSYVPIEGCPINRTYGKALGEVERSGGSVVVYCESAADALRKQFPELRPVVAYHGSDHAEFRRYSDADRSQLRKLVGLDRYFVAGAVGTNKRTKQHPVLIYAARILKERGMESEVRIYIHTEPDAPIVDGYPLRQLAAYYGVEDMILWKPDPDSTRGGVNRGVVRDNNWLARARRMQTPSTSMERASLFAQYDMVSRFNCLDMYVDVSELEGWGLPSFEAMACGVPTAVVDDGWVRREVHLRGAYRLEPIPQDCWPTLHTGARLASVSPSTVADAICEIRRSPTLREDLTAKGQQLALEFRWDAAREVLTRAVQTALARGLQGK